MEASTETAVREEIALGWGCMRSMFSHWLCSECVIADSLPARHIRSSPAATRSNRTDPVLLLGQYQHLFSPKANKLISADNFLNLTFRCIPNRMVHFWYYITLTVNLGAPIQIGLWQLTCMNSVELCHWFPSWQRHCCNCINVPDSHTKTEIKLV